MANIKRVMRRVRNATRYLAHGDFVDLVKRIGAYRQDVQLAHSRHYIAQTGGRLSWGILATRHTLFIGRLMADRLQAHGWNVKLTTTYSKDFQHDFSIVICPQMFKRLPPRDRRIVVQMEQSVSSRWFSRRYFKTLRESMAVFDYALVNLDYLAANGVAFPRVHYLPIGALPAFSDPNRVPRKTTDVLFYGDTLRCERRRRMLDALKQRFKVRVVSKVFGDTMWEMIRQAKVVINLHYYENALLETPRIAECLSLGTPVVSESSQDQEDYPELHRAVQFFEQGSIPAMLDAVEAALQTPVSPETIAGSIEQSHRRFNFMFDRALVALGCLPRSHVGNMPLPLPWRADRLVLSLPETIGRRRAFESVRPNGYITFDGIRSSPGWVGCGLSYQAAARYAIEQKLKRFTVMEDDALLPPDFEAKLSVVHEFLDARHGQWDVFAGVIALLHPDTRVLDISSYKGMTFVTLNRMTSMVYNIYGDRALRRLMAWNADDRDADSNTVDRYLQQQDDLRVVVTLPFLVGHRDEMHSTLWGFRNAHFHDLIAGSQRQLQNMAAAFRPGGDLRRECA